MVDSPSLDPEITVADVGDRTAVISVHGELDLASATEFRAALQERDGGRRSSLVLDLVGTTFIDSTALGVISAASKALRRIGGSLTVVVTDPRILRIFTLTGLDRSVRVERSLADAIARALVPTSA
jgi:anti-sigma B factor antagonist